jgi:two-component system sensor histidine kinase CpxA
LQNQPAEDQAGVIEKLQQDTPIRLYLFNEAGVELLDRSPPPAVRQAAAQLSRQRRRAMLDSPDGRVLAHIIVRSDMPPQRAVFVLPHPANKWLGVLGENLWLRLGLAVIISGLVCYGLSRIMTSRLKELQLASRRLAGGELDARIEVRPRGGDETDELARDFNSMASQLQERIYAQKRLLGDVSHELRSPLARLRIALALAQEDKDNEAAHLGRIEREAERLEELIAQLLSSQAGGIDLDSHIDLVELLAQLCADAEFEGAAVDKRVVFRHQLEHAIVASAGDLLHKSFDNILRNALQHTAAGGEVLVTLEAEGRGYHLRFEDQGPGVPEQELNNIFEEFYRVDTARTRESGGYGLGLAISRRAILRHGGTIEAANTGTGLAIDIFLPRGE